MAHATVSSLIATHTHAEMLKKWQVIEMLSKKTEFDKCIYPIAAFVKKNQNIATPWPISLDRVIQRNSG